MCAYDNDGSNTITLNVMVICIFTGGDNGVCRVTSTIRAEAWVRVKIRSVCGWVGVLMRIASSGVIDADHIIHSAQISLLVTGHTFQTK